MFEPYRDSKRVLCTLKIRNLYASRWLTEPYRQESRIKNYEEVKEYVEKAKKKSELERQADVKDKTGVKIEGIVAINPVNGKEIPIFAADYVLSNYGTGAIMAVPAHDQRDFEFAKEYDLPVLKVILPPALSQTLTSPVDVALGKQDSMRVVAESIAHSG